MKVRLVCQETIDDYVAVDPKRRALFGDWFMQVKHARWNNPSDIRNMSYHACFLGSNSRRVVFSIGRNGYRMICMYVFARKAVHLLVCWVGTYVEYRRLPNRKRQHVVTSRF